MTGQCSERTPPARGAVTQKVVERVAEAEGVAPEELTPPLYDVVDPDALERLFRSTDTADRMNGKVVFPYNGYDVHVAGDGHVALE